MRKRFISTLAATVLSLSGAPAADARAAQNPRLQGTWILDRAASDDIDKAVDPRMIVLDQCGTAARGLDEMVERLKSMNPLSSQYVISFDAQTVRIQEAGRRDATVPTNGSHVFWDPARGPGCWREDINCMDLSARFAGDALDLQLVGRDLRQSKHFAADADRLTVTVTVNMTCALPMRYRLVFTRGAGL